jgi:hypothetical protein
MQGKSLLSAVLAAFVVGLVATTAQAAPSGFGGAIEQSAGRSGLVDKVTWYRKGYYGHYGHYHRPYRSYGWYGRRHYGHRHYGHGWYGKRHYGGYSRYGYRHW